MDDNVVVQNLNRALKDSYAAGYQAGYFAAKQEQLDRNMALLEECLKNGNNRNVSMQDSRGGTAFYKFRVYGYDYGCNDFDPTDISLH